MKRASEGQSREGQSNEPDWDAIRAEKNAFIARQVAYKGAIELRVAEIIKDDQVWDLVDKHTEKLLGDSQATAEDVPPARDEDAPPFA